jgi:hypothetical protein
MADHENDDGKKAHHGLSGWAIFIIVVVILALLAGLAFYLYTRLYKKRSSVSSALPAPAPGGIVGWLNTKFQSLKNSRSRTGAGYESAGPTAYGGAARGAHRGPLDPDEAWDSRVGNEADVYGPGGYYEEQELGLHAPTSYSGAGYGGGATAAGGANPGFTPAPGLSAAPEKERGRSRSPGPAENPFGDDAAASLRGISPKPPQLSAGPAKKKGGKSREGSPTTFERRSMFREDM